MDRIEKYLKSLSKEVHLGPQEMVDFKAEIRNHLLDTNRELRQQGKSEDESATIAIHRFGEEKLINAQLRKVHRVQTKSRNSVFAASIVFVLLSILFMVSSFSLDQRNTSDYDGMQRDYHSQIAEKIAASDKIAIADIEAFYNENKRILRFVHISEVDNNGLTTQYIYPSSTTKEQLNQQSYIPYSISTEGGNRAEWEIKIALNNETLFSETPSYLFLVSIVCFGVYWVLYGLWNIRNAYRMNRLNIVWVFLFLSLNVFAYLLFRVEGKIKLDKLEATV